VTQRFEGWAIAPMNLKIGLLNQLDVQLLLEPYNVHYESEDGTRVTRRGYGDTTVRVKYNFWGNDGGRTAFAATPYVKFPTGQDGIGNRGVEAASSCRWRSKLPRAFYLGGTARFDAVRDEEESVTTPSFINSIAFGHDLFGSLFGYVEFFSAVSTERNSNWVGTFDTGLNLPVDGERPVEPRTGHRCDPFGGRLDCVRRDCVAVLAPDSIRAGFPPALPGAAQD